MHSVETQLHEVSRQGSFSEFLHAHQSPSIAALAPHGGQVEPNTDLEAELLRDRLPSTSVWGTRGVTAAGGYNRAFRQWHTTTETHGFEEFPLYQELSGEEYEVAIGFHGMAREGVVVVGDGNEFLKTDLAARIDEVIDSEVRVQGVGSEVDSDNELDVPTDTFTGALDAGESVHIMQSLEVMTEPEENVECVVEWVSESGGLISTQ